MLSRLQERFPAGHGFARVKIDLPLSPNGDYAGRMTFPSPSHRLLSVEKVRSLAAANPDYGREFTDADWERITERLEALARLLWEFSQQQVEAEIQTRESVPPIDGPLKPQ